MSIISEKYQEQKLNKYNISIKTSFFDDGKIVEKYSNKPLETDIDKGIVVRKDYYKNNSLLHSEDKFDSRIEYSYIGKNSLNKNHKCPNCGMEGKIKDFIDGCPYCRTIYNIEYVDKDLGSKYHYDRVLRNTTYRLVTLVVDIIVSLIVSFIFIKSTSRTFNAYDVSKVFIYGAILSLILYYFFYILDAYVILTPIKNYKDRENQKQIDFWNRTGIDKKKFFNNFNYEVKKKYYMMDDVIDYDIMDYLGFEEYEKDNRLHVKVKVDVRVVYYKNGRIYSKFNDQEFVLERLETDKLELKDGANIIKCLKCGASIDATKSKCDYCGTEINYLQEWIMEK